VWKRCGDEMCLDIGMLGGAERRLVGSRASYGSMRDEFSMITVTALFYFFLRVLQKWI
jgi:hypothetical protein